MALLSENHCFGHDYEAPYYYIRENISATYAGLTAPPSAEKVLPCFPHLTYLSIRPSSLNIARWQESTALLQALKQLQSLDIVTGFCSSEGAGVISLQGLPVISSLKWACSGRYGPRSGSDVCGRRLDCLSGQALPEIIPSLSYDRALPLVRSGSNNREYTWDVQQGCSRMSVLGSSCFSHYRT